MTRSNQPDSAPGSAPAPTRRVRFDIPGVQAIGRYRPRQTYDVPATEAKRLVTHKGFQYVDGAAAPAADNQEN